MKPIRVQRKRTKGYKLPPNTICVTRPGRFGNPFETAAQFRTWLERLMDGNPLPALDTPQARRMHDISKRLDKLTGFNLACFCPLDQPCHADVLLEFANQAAASQAAGEKTE